MDKIKAIMRQSATIGGSRRRNPGIRPGAQQAKGSIVVSRYAGALLRALLVALVISIPSMTLHVVSDDVTQIVALVSFFAAAITFFEYASVYPGLIEFRDAPPYNRIRFTALFAMVTLLSVTALAQLEPSTLSQFVYVLGAMMARSVDIPYSPVRLLVLILPEDAPAARVEALRTAAGIAYMTALIALGYFVVMIRALGWPKAQGSFNVWVNLPTFEPTAGADVVERLRRDAWFNISLGFLLPFLVPVLIKAISVSVSPVTLDSPLTMIWVVTAWAFLPASLFMRGIAVGRIAQMIEDKRRAAGAAEQMLPA